ncbi:NRAMP family divalent metal transporter [Salinimonas chungwhensis]|uniref:NRAMP family divalent metal transporter n=1 Tax=Salinimonas chungwhensis TaxID=265425 RepID=UPI0003649A58|nr:divalent metal cation transporter [Salinimonas chungwhensis]
MLQSQLNTASRLIKSLGPGILMATAAIGGSHLVAATQAGAHYGWQLVILIIAVNILKYPFFRAAVTYTVDSGQTLQQGYLSMGRGYLLMAMVINCVAAVVNAAALLMFAASLLGYFLPFTVPVPMLAAIVLATILFILLAGHFEAMNKAAKLIMLLLVISTVTAAVVAGFNGPAAPPDFSGESPWTVAAIGFLVITMGWMPAPIEISAITSLWLKRQQDSVSVTPASALFDFNLGYITTTLLAVVFLALGALILYGSGKDMAVGGIGFSRQLVSLYASTIGEWSRYLIATIAFLCIFGSALTVYDGYCRAITEALGLLRGTNDEPERHFTKTLLLVAIISFIIVLFFQSALLAMLGFAMTLAFTTTPLFAWLNHRLVNTSRTESSFGATHWLRRLSLAGLIYLFGFLGVFIWWQFVSS